VTDASTLQAELARFLRLRRDLTRNEAAVRFADEHIGGNDRLSPVEQLEIYREQFWLRHTESLVEDFPGLGGILGQAAWDELVWAYLVEVPPASHDLGELGAGLAAFIATREGLEQRALLHDMASLEYSHVAVFGAPDRPKLDPQKLAEIPDDAWEHARLLLDPALRVHRFIYPVVALRRRLAVARDEAEPSEAVPLPEPEAEPKCVAVHRRDRLIYHDELEPLAFALLTTLMSGQALGVACETAAQQAGVAVEALGEHLGRWFQEWAGRGYVVDVVSNYPE
jgi:hypothetical protein